MDKYLKWELAAGIALISCSVFYYLVIFLPHTKEVDARQQQAQQSLERQKETDAATAAQQQAQQSLESQKEADAATARQQEQYATLKASYRAECVATEEQNLKSAEALVSGCRGDLQAVRTCIESINNVVGNGIGEAFIVACTNNKLKE